MFAFLLIFVERSDEDNFLRDELAKVFASLVNREKHTDAVERWGRPCANPGEIR